MSLILHSPGHGENCKMPFPCSPSREPGWVLSPRCAFTCPVTCLCSGEGDELFLMEPFPRAGAGKGAAALARHPGWPRAAVRAWCQLPPLGDQGVGEELGCAGPKAAMSQLVPSTELLHDKHGWWPKVPGDIFCRGALSSSGEATAEAKTQIP